MFSIRQKTPEVEIPEKSFYNQLPGMNLYVEHKDRETGRLDKLIIYDTSRGMDNVRVIFADSGRISFTEDKSHISVQLYDGEMYEDFKDNVMGSGNSRNMPFRRETFNQKTAFIAYDANFNRMDDSVMRQQYIGKNITQLRHSIDSISNRVDSIGISIGTELKEKNYVGVPYYENSFKGQEVIKTVKKPVNHDPIDVDSLFQSYSPEVYRRYLSTALNKAHRAKNEFEFKTLVLDEEQKILRRHEIEMHRKFTLSLACLIFFFIGAPLGAIIKKGGLGMPLVISVFLFIVYYIFDNMGYKLARDGKMDVIAGIWLSTCVMLPLGAFFTYKAVGDTTMFDFDMYKRMWRKLKYRFNVKKVHDDAFVMKDFAMDDVLPHTALSLIENVTDKLNAYNAIRGGMWNMIGLLKSRKAKSQFNAALSDMISYLSNTRDYEVINQLNRLPILIEPRTVNRYKDVLISLRDIFQPDKKEDNKDE